MYLTLFIPSKRFSVMSDELRLAVLSAALHADALGVLVDGVQAAYDRSLTMDADLVELDRVCADAHSSVLSARAVSSALTGTASQRGSDALYRAESNLRDAEEQLADLQRRSISRRLQELDAKRRGYRAVASEVRHLRSSLRGVLPPVEVSVVPPSAAAYREPPPTGGVGNAVDKWVRTLRRELRASVSQISKASAGEASGTISKTAQVLAAHEASKAIFEGCADTHNPLPWAASIEQLRSNPSALSDHYRQLMGAWGGEPAVEPIAAGLLSTTCSPSSEASPLLPPSHHIIVPRYTYQTAGELKRVEMSRMEVSIQAALSLPAYLPPSDGSVSTRAQMLRLEDACDNGGRTWPAVVAIDQ